jgi:hypothetical protein
LGIRPGRLNPTIRVIVTNPIHFVNGRFQSVDSRPKIQRLCFMEPESADIRRNTASNLGGNALPHMMGRMGPPEKEPCRGRSPEVHGPEDGPVGCARHASSGTIKTLWRAPKALTAGGNADQRARSRAKQPFSVRSLDRTLFAGSGQVLDESLQTPATTHDGFHREDAMDGWARTSWKQPRLLLSLRPALRLMAPLFRGLFEQWLVPWLQGNPGNDAGDISGIGASLRGEDGNHHPVNGSNTATLTVCLST